MACRFKINKKNMFARVGCRRRWLVSQRLAVALRESTEQEKAWLWKRAAGCMLCDEDENWNRLKHSNNYRLLKKKEKIKCDRSNRFLQVFTDFDRFDQKIVFRVFSDRFQNWFPVQSMEPAVRSGSDITVLKQFVR